jgi:hypothetical protein
MVSDHKIKLDLLQIPPMTVDEEAFLMREHKSFPWKRMTRQQIEEQYPGALDNFGKVKGKVKEIYQK